MLTQPFSNGEKGKKARQVVRNIASGVVNTFKTLKEALDFIDENKAEIEEIKADVKDIASDIKNVAGEVKKTGAKVKTIVTKAKTQIKK